MVFLTESFHLPYEMNTIMLSIFSDKKIKTHACQITYQWSNGHTALRW